MSSLLPVSSSSTSSLPSSHPSSLLSRLSSLISSSSPSSSFASSLSSTEATTQEEPVNPRDAEIEEKNKMSRCFIGWMIFACLDFFFFVPGGFLLAIVGYNCHSTAMMVSGAILLLIFLIVIPGFGIGLVVRKQYRDTNKIINMANKCRRVSTLSRTGCGQHTPTGFHCVVSTSNNNFYDFSRCFSHDKQDYVVETIKPVHKQGVENSQNIAVVDCSYHNDDIIYEAPVLSATPLTPTDGVLSPLVKEATGNVWMGNFIADIFTPRSSQRSGYAELP